MNQFYSIWEEGLAHSFQWTSQTVCRTMPHNRHPFLPQNCQHYECANSAKMQSLVVFIPYQGHLGYKKLNSTLDHDFQDPHNLLVTM